MHSLLLLSDRAVGEVLTSALQQRRGLVSWVSSLADALTRLSSGPFDVLFVDWDLPHHSLSDVVQAVRAADPDNPRLIVAVGRPPDDAALASARDAGLSDILEVTDSQGNLDLRLDAIEHLAEAATLQAEEAALARSEHRYRRIVEDGLTPIFEHDFDGHLLWANSVFLRLSGYSLDELRQKTLTDLLAPSAHFGISWYMQDLIRDGWTEGAVRTQGSDGTVGYWLFRSLVTSDAGRHQVTGYGYDITAARLAEEALRRSEARARELAEEANERVKELQMLAEVGQVVEGELDHAALYQSVVQQLFDAFGYASVGVYTADPDGHTFTREYLALNGHSALPEWLRDAQPHVQQLLNGGGAAVRWAGGALAPGVAGNTAPLGLVPIHDGVRTIALVAIEPRPEEDLTDDDLRRLRLIADLVDNVVGRGRLFTEARESEARFRSAFDDAAIGMALLALDGTWWEANAAAQALLGYAQAELRTTTALALTHPQDVVAVRSGMERLLTGLANVYRAEQRFIQQDGHEVWALLSLSLVRDEHGKPQRFIAQIEDISQRKSLEERLRYLALHDPVTGLPNRRQFNERLDASLRARRPDRQDQGVVVEDSDIAVMFVDLDGFKGINDTMGHEVGDSLLIEVGQRFRMALRPDDLVARFGGDEFTVLLAEIGSADEAIRFADRMLESLREPIEVAGLHLGVNASIGLSFLSDDPEASAGQLLHQADVALYRAKTQGRGRVVSFESGRDGQHRHSSAPTLAPANGVRR